MALARAEAQWQARGPKSYRFEILLTCECFPKGMNVRVTGGHAVLPRVQMRHRSGSTKAMARSNACVTEGAAAGV